MSISSSSSSDEYILTPVDELIILTNVRLSKIYHLDFAYPSEKLIIKDLPSGIEFFVFCGWQCVSKNHSVNGEFIWQNAEFRFEDTDFKMKDLLVLDERDKLYKNYNIENMMINPQNIHIVFVDTTNTDIFTYRFQNETINVINKSYNLTRNGGSKYTFCLPIQKQ